MTKQGIFEYMLRAHACVYVTLRVSPHVRLPAQCSDLGAITLRYTRSADIRLDAIGMYATLMFDGRPFRTWVPWDHTYLLASRDPDAHVYAWHASSPGGTLGASLDLAPDAHLVRNSGGMSFAEGRLRARGLRVVK